MEIEIVTLIVTCCYTFVALYIQLNFTKKMNEQNNLMQASLSIHQKANNRDIMTSEVYFAHIMVVYKELSQLLYENYFGMRQIIVEHERKVSSRDEENYNKLCIYVGANSYALRQEIRDSLAKFENINRFLLESLSNEDADLGKNVDELHEIYNEIISRIQDNIGNFKFGDR